MPSLTSNKCDVTRLTDAAAAYIAQLTYALLLRPWLPEPPIGLPLDNMMRQSMHLVNKYELGSSAGYGAMIDQRDIADLARAVYAIPDYHDIDPDAKLAANGVALSDEQSEEFYRRQMQRLMNQDTSGTDASLKARYASYEDYVTSDNELLTLFDSYRRGGDAQKKTALQRLLRIFLTIDNRAAVELLQKAISSTKNCGGGFHRRNTAGLNQGDFLASDGEHLLCLPTYPAPFRFGGAPLKRGPFLYSTYSS